MAECRPLGSRRNYWALRVKAWYAKHNTELHTVEVLCPRSESKVFYFTFKSENFKGSGRWNSLNTRGFKKNAIWIMSRFMQKTNGHINYIAYNSSASFFIFISGTCLANNPHLQGASTSHSVRISHPDLFLITKDIINIFCLNWNSNPFFFHQVGCGQRTSR